MNKEITIYELLGLIKDGQAPKHIKFRDEEWWWGYDAYTYFDDLNNTPDAQLSMFSKYRINYCLNDKVEIIEEDNKIEKLDIGKMLQTKKWKRDKKTWQLINELIDEVNKLKKDK